MLKTINCHSLANIVFVTVIENYKNICPFWISLSLQSSQESVSVLGSEDIILGGWIIYLLFDEILLEVFPVLGCNCSIGRNL